MSLLLSHITYRMRVNNLNLNLISLMDEPRQIISNYVIYECTM